MNTKKILIVEDEAIIAMELENILTRFGYNVAGKAHNSENAVLEAEKIDPDLILMDINLGTGKSGIETAAIIKEKKDVPVIYLTAYADEETLKKAKATGPYGYLTKPFREPELKATLEMAFEKIKADQFQNIKFLWIAEQSDDGYIILNSNDIIQYASLKAKSLLRINGDKSSIHFMEHIRSHFNLRPENGWELWPGLNTEADAHYLIDFQDAKTVWLKINILFPDTAGDFRVVRIRDVSSEMEDTFEIRTFNSLISHKFMTPMNHLMTSLSLLESGTLAAEDTKEFSHIALDGARRLHDTIKDILEFKNSFRSGSGVYELNFLKDQIQSVLSSLEITKIDFRLPDPAGLKIDFSEKGMEILLLEILENAKKFHPQNDPSLIIEGEIGEKFILKIHNDGPPLPDEYLEKIWEPYFQGEKHLTGEIAGTGLGLSAVRMLVWSSRGSCRIKNSPLTAGICAEFSFEIHP